jgi:phenylpropionate dioxygenase-like ring-hydroxylating dioxygenase large terminal subunit
MTMLPALTLGQTKILTETGPGTPCGKFFRRYWQPVALLTDILPGMPPTPLKVMGEDLVLFRDGRGKVGLIGRYCPHRGVDLGFARVENEGLRCIYHGWLMGANGSCLDQAGQPKGTEFERDVKHAGYPCVEAAGCVFAYLGEGAPPPLPPYDIFTINQAHVAAARYLYEGNYIYDFEHNLDTAHVSFIHIQFLESERSGKFGQRPQMGVTGTDLSANTLYAMDQAPILKTEQVEYGLRITTLRKAAPGREFIRGMEFLYPNVNTAPVHANGYTMQFHVPIDDNSHWRFDINLARDRTFDHAALAKHREKTHFLDGRLRRNKSNNYLQDRSTMDDWYAGMGSFPPDHDGVVLEATWSIDARVNEQLGSQDIGIVQTRDLMLRAIADLEAGRDPPPASLPGAHAVVAFSAVVPEGASWKQLWTDRDLALNGKATGTTALA